MEKTLVSVQGFLRYKYHKNNFKNIYHRDTENVNQHRLMPWSIKI